MILSVPVPALEISRQDSPEFAAALTVAGVLIIIHQHPVDEIWLTPFNNVFLFILGKNYHRVGPDTDFAGAR